MRVAIIIPRLTLLGPVIIMQNLVNEIYNCRDLTIKLFYIDREQETGMNISVQVERLDRRKFRCEDFDIIHTSGLRPDLFAFRNRKKIKYYISTIHNFVFDDLAYSYGVLASKIFGNIWIMLWKRADKLVCVSDTLKQYYSNWFSPVKLIVIHNGIKNPVNPLSPDPEIEKIIEKYRSEELKVIGFVGILTRRKGLDQLLYLIAAEPGFALIIIGDGKEHAELQQLSLRLDVADRSCFYGFRRNVSDYFHYFDFFVMPSRSEGFGLALIEAVQQKVPVICSDLPVFRELFTSNEVTFYEKDNITSLQSALRTACAEGKSKTGPASQKYESRYTSRIMGDKYLELYKSA
jgi:glycosyltransferase involved in cell wall biosynthesis